MPTEKQAYIPIDGPFRLMADSAPVMIWVSGTDKLCYFLNAGWLRFRGRTLEQETGNGWAKGVHPDDLHRCIQTYIQAFEKRRDYKMEYRLLRHDGQYRWIYSTGVPRYTESGEFAGYVGSCVDIDELMESERVKQNFISTSALRSEKQFNEQLALANEELSTSNEELAAINEEFQIAQSKLAALNAELEDQVRLRTAELEQSEQEQIALNEELAASNEELAATNEEIATTNEELSSVNDGLLESQERLRETVARLAESEHRLRGLVASSPFPIAVYEGREMRIVLANQSILDVWGKGDDVFGTTYRDLLPELESQDIYNQLDAVFTTGVAFNATNQKIDLIVDGQLRQYYFNYSFTPLFNTEGKVWGVVNTAADITELELARQQIEQSGRNLHNMILQAPVAMCILLGQELRVEVANDLMIGQWGKTRGDVWNKPIFEVLGDARNPELKQIMTEVYITGKGFRANEHPVTRSGNGVTDVLYQDLVYEPYRDSDGNILGIIATTIDVTAQVQARQRLEQNLEEMHKLQQQKDGFIGIASHELKTPLTTLSALIQVLTAKLNNSPDPFIAGALSKATVQIKKMTNLINGFLNISRLESGKILIDKQPFRLDELLKDMVDEIQITTQQHVITLTEHPSVEVVADKEKIGSVITNLLSNAVKYSPGGKRIDVGYKLTGTSVEVCVSDEGMGIAQPDIEHLFDRYYRVESANTKHISGFGIGLYLSSEIIKQHGGQIWAESKADEGSTFKFTLPVKA